MNSSALAIVIYVAAAVSEIAGCFAFWSWLRQGKTMLWLLPGTMSAGAYSEP